MKSIQRFNQLFAALVLFGAGCSSGSEGAKAGASGTSSGGESSSGGSTSGSESASGGAGSGGSTSSSSSSQSGGAGAAGSRSESGGTSSGGTSANGGAGASGGRTTSRTETTNAGGRTGTSSTSSTSGAAGATGGTPSTTPSTTPSADPVPSPGCSATPTTTSPCTNTASAPCTIDVKGTKREYYLNLPSGYDGKKPVPVVWEYHPMGGNAKSGMTMYQLNSKLTNVIFVSPQGLGSTPGFPNTSGQDEEMTRAINAEMEAKYCTDKSRYFATGFSYGGSMSFTAACNMSDIFRAVGAESGSIVSGATCASKKPARMVAVWATHGDADTVLPIDRTKPMIEALVKNNGCTTTTVPVDPSPCVAYQGCKDGFPVVWCVRPGDGHTMPNTAPAAITKFFQQYF